MVSRIENHCEKVVRLFLEIILNVPLKTRKKTEKNSEILFINTF